jgi:ribosomal protein L3 glutamine methyltransferase
MAARLPAPPASGTLRAWIAYAVQRFTRARLVFGHGTGNAHDEAVWLLVHVLGIRFEDLDAAADRVLGGARARKALRLIEARITTRKPLAYLLKEAWLAGECFYVDERVIVPRSFIAELLPESLDPWLRRRRIGRVLDLCTGSGCLAILAARRFAGAQVDAADISPAALAVARRNVTTHRLRSRIGLLRGDLLGAVRARRYELILTNPPYVDAASMKRLPAEYLREPGLALASGRDGLDAIIRILDGAADHLTPGGLLVAEIGHNRAALERRRPRLSFTWMNTSAGDDMVFALTREELLGA